MHHGANLFAMNKKITLALLFITSLFIWAFFEPTPFTISGKVTDNSGNPLASVAVSEIGVNNQTTTDAAGKYQIIINHKSATLRFSYVGYEMEEKKVKAGQEVNQELNIVLNPSQQKLEEVVVTGYGKRSKSLLENRSYKMVSPGIVSGNYATTEDYGVPPYHGEVDKDSQVDFNREGYDGIVENRFKKVTDNPLSTFSIDVDAASYSNLRRFINYGSIPPAGAIRIEEMINYFRYEYPQPTGEHPFSINTEISECPWNTKHQLALIGLQGKNIPTENLPASNLVFLIDVSGSMQDANKLPLVKSSLKLLVDQLRNQDRVAIAVYAGSAGLVLPPTNGSNKKTIANAIDNLSAGGSTAGGEGIKLAYKTAKEYFIKGGNNRVILCTDGDFNVGVSSDDELERLIENERESGVFLSVLGFGMGNYQDAKMQKLADKGNGNHSYIDGMSEARKVFVSEFGGTLFTIAKDVKLQIEFNPAKVQAYRLIGYENRMLNKEDFNNDKKDAGELGSGHTVTALYEIIPVGVKNDFTEEVDPLKYQKTQAATNNGGNEIMTVKFRYKKPDGDKSTLIVHPVKNITNSFSSTSNNFRFAAAVAQFGLLLRKSEFRQNASYNNVLSMAKSAMGTDSEGYRHEFVKLVENAKQIDKTADKATGMLK
jgi:Ca-activated chloride channel family protein